MKITAILLLAASLQVSASGWGQEKISLSFSHAPLEEVLNTIKAQADVVFVYRTDYIKDKKITINVSNATLRSVLDICLKNQQLTYEIIGRNVAIRPERDKKGVSLNEFPSNNVTGDGEIKGRVLTKEGEPLVSANVVNKRTGKGTTTDANGNFSLEDVTKNDILVISYTGFAPRNVKVSEFITLTLVMEPAVNELDQVVMQAYGTTTRRLNTGNIAKITSKEINDQPVINPLQLLQGRVPGLVITQTNGYGSAPFKVELRGRNNINDKITADPLYIIDGVPLTISEISGSSSYTSGASGFVQNNLPSPAGGQSPFFSINPTDIESIEILKDADATAIYGSRGANGVILISTKRGKAGKAKVNVNFSQGMSAVTRQWKMLNTQQYVEMRKEAFQNENTAMTPSNAYDILLWDTTRYTDWQKIIWGNIGKVTDAQIDLSGGNSQVTFRIGSGFNHRTDITTFKGSDDRMSISLHLAYKSLNQKFGVSLSNLFSYAKSNMVFMAGGNAALFAPNAPEILDENIKLNYSGWVPANYPFANLFQPYTAKTKFQNTNLVLNYELLKGLNIRSSFGYNSAQAKQTQFVPITSLDPASSPTGTARFGSNEINNWIIEPQIEYNNLIANGKLNILAGSTFQSNNTNGQTTIGSGYTSDLLLYTISNAPTKTATELYGQYKYSAIFGRITYNLKNKYIINLSARRDGSSRFGEGKQFGNFGAVGAAWIFSEEAFIERYKKFLSFGKIRGSYGTTGSDAVLDYQYLTRWSSAGTFSYSSMSSLVPIQHSNDQYHWPTNKKLEAAVDLGIMQDRLIFSFAWYRHRCNDQLVSFPLAVYTGFNTVTANSPANVQNMGWELTLAGKIINNKKLNWSIQFNTGLNRNKLLDYPNLNQSPYANLYIVGEPLNIARKLHSIGVDPQTGQYAFEDKSEDGIISTKSDSTDDRYIFNANPKFIGGMGTNLSFKGLELSMFFNIIKQKGNNSLYSLGATPGTISNISPEVFNNRWRKPGDASEFAKLTTNVSNVPYSNFYNSDGIYTDASYIRLSNISLSYNLPTQLIKKVGLQGIRLSVNAQNLLTITNYKGLDPETQNFGGMPPAKTIIVKFSLTL